MRRKKITNFLKRQWILVWLVLALVSLMAVISYASYKNANNKIKRVVAPAAKTEGLFTSNYLALGAPNIKTAYCDENNTNTYTYNVDIRNYNPADPDTVFKSPIPYTLSVQLVHRDGTPYDKDADAEALTAMRNGNMSITVALSGTEETITLDGTAEGSCLHGTAQRHTLSGTGADKENRWIVTYNGIILDSDYCVKFTAIPQAGLNLDTISATVIVASYPVVNPEGWDCKLVESGIITDYDAFNYTISGTGTKDLYFSYDATKLRVNVAFYGMSSADEIDAPISYAGGGNAAAHSGWQTIIIHANPDSLKINRYDLQIYKVDNKTWKPTSWTEITPNEVDSLIEFK